MKEKIFNEIEKIEERNEIVLLFANWLEPYCKEVIEGVMAKANFILNDDFSMKLLRELKEREEVERKEFNNSIGNLFYDFEGYRKYNPHNHIITHAKSYRDVLHDMYIKDIHV